MLCQVLIILFPPTKGPHNLIMVIALQTVFDRRWLLELNICTSSMWWSWFLQSKLIIYSLLKSANRLKDIHSHLSRQINGHNGFRKGFPTYPKGFLKASTSAKEKKKLKKKKHTQKTKEIRTIMADCMNCENVTVTATFHYVCLWVMINRRCMVITSKEGFTL